MDLQPSVRSDKRSRGEGTTAASISFARPKLKPAWGEHWRKYLNAALKPIGGLHIEEAP